MSEASSIKSLYRKIDSLKESNDKALDRYDRRLDRLRRRLQRLEITVDSLIVASGLKVHLASEGNSWEPGN